MAFLLSRSRGKSVQKWQPDSARHLEKILTATIMEIAVSGTQVAALRLANEYGICLLLLDKQKNIAEKKEN